MASSISKAQSRITQQCTGCLEIKAGPWSKTGDRCMQCYERMRSSIEKRCTVCERIKRGRWYKDPETSTTTRCRACYKKAGLFLKQKCTGCRQTKKIIKWKLDPKTQTKTLCHLCQKAFSSSSQTAAKPQLKKQRLHPVILRDPTEQQLDSGFPFKPQFSEFLFLMGDLATPTPDLQER
jgi:hypothetical protein